MNINKNNHSKLLVLLSILIVLIPSMASIRLFSSEMSNMLIGIFVFIIYMFSVFQDNEIKYYELILLLYSSLPMVLNRTLNMSSLPIIIMLFFLLEREQDTEKYLKVYFITSTLIFLVIFLANLVFDFNSNYDVDMWRIDKIIYRKSLGFSHPNVAMMTFMTIVFSYMGLLKKIGLRRKIITLIFVTYMCFFWTQSRTSAYAIFGILLIALLLGEKVFDKLPNIYRPIISIFPIILTALSLVVLFLPRNSTLNRLFSGRQDLYQTFYNNIGGIKFLSSPILETAMFDNGYLHALLAKGTIFTYILLSIYTFILNRYSSRISILQSLVVIAFFLIAFTETSLFRFEIFYPVILLLNKKNYERAEEG